MDIDALHSTLLSIAVISEKVQTARDQLRLPVNTLSCDALLADIKTNLQIAKATLAEELGFMLCRDCWPAEVLIARRDGVVKCPACESATQRAA